MTLNINAYETKHGPWAARKEIICQAITKAQPDIIALQAVRADPEICDGIDQAAQLKADLPQYPYVVFHPYSFHSDGTADGSAFLSRQKPIDTGSLDLSLRRGHEDKQPRCVVNARFDFPTGCLHVFNAHFSWIHEQALDNLDETLRYMKIFAGQVALVGDFNIAPETDFLGSLGIQGWSDVWERLHPEQTGYTFEAHQPSKRIDYVWANNVLSERINNINLAANEQWSNGFRASNHCGLVVDMSL